MKSIELPSDGVLVLVARAQPNSSHVDIHVSEEWWASASKDHRKALFIACIESLGELGNRVIPEEFGPDANRPLEPLPPLPEPAQMRLEQLERLREIDEVLAAQVRGLLILLEAGGDVRTANLDDRLFTDRLQDTLDARAKIAVP